MKWQSLLLKTMDVIKKNSLPESIGVQLKNDVIVEFFGNLNVSSCDSTQSENFSYTYLARY